MMSLTKRLVVLIGIVMLAGIIFNNNLANDLDAAPPALISASAPTTEVQPTSTIVALSESSSLTAKAYGVYTTTGIKLDSSAETKRWPIASLTKLMTAVVARDLIPATQKIEIKSVNPEVEGFAGNFSAGEIFTARDLEKALLIVSSNTAANAIADFYGRERFVDTMNNYAYKLGLENTYFADPSGLSYKNQSTVEDLAELVTYIMNTEPGIFKVTRTTRDSMYNYKTGKRRTVSNINQFAGKPQFIGGKTGTTPEAIGNLISIFSSGGKASGKIIILLGTESRYDETNNLLATWSH